MDEPLTSWLRRCFADPVREGPLIEEELRPYPPEVRKQFHEESRLIADYFDIVLKDGNCPPEVWLPLHAGLSQGAQALIKQIDRVVCENRKASRLQRKLGLYRLLYRVGAGGMAEVYAVEKTDIGVKRRALKIIHLAEQYHDWPAATRQRLLDELAGRLREEAANLEKIHHPRIVRYFDVSIDPASGELYIVTELIEGVSLERLVEKGGPLPPEEALTVVTAICDGLVEVHKKELIHRDLTPANVLIDRDGDVKIIDFGLSQSILPSETGFRTGVDRFHWRTKRYASPEQLRREKATKASDLYTLGKLFYFLLLHRPGWEGEDDWPIPPRHDLLAQGLPQGYADLILRATAEVPAERFSSAAEMLAALRQLGGDNHPLRECIPRVRELQEENDPGVNFRVGKELGTQAMPPPLPGGADSDVPAGIVVEDEKLTDRPRRRVLIASAFAGLSLLVLTPLFLLSGLGAGRKGTDSTPKQISSAASIPFKGECYWRLTGRLGAQVPAKGIPLGASDASFLKGGDRVYFQAELSEGEAAYFYVLHIDVKGTARQLYPPGWTWQTLPSGETPRKLLRLPQTGGDAPLEDSSTGLESLLWLVRLQPLTQDDNAALEKLLTAPELTWQQAKEIQQMREDQEGNAKPLWMENGVFRDKRGVVLLDQARIANDPPRQTEKVMLAIRDQKLASYTRAVCYLFLSGKNAEPK